MNKLNELDLNTLRVVHALLEEGQVTRVARRLRQSQPAVSHALARAREALDDPLFVRVGTGLVPTARALGMREPLRLAFDQLGQAIGTPTPFSPADDARTFVIATVDYGSITVVDRLIRQCRSGAPRVRFDVVNVPASPEVALAKGSIDLVLAPGDTATGAGVRRQRVHDDGFVCLLDRGNPIAGHWSLTAYIEASHVQIAPRGLPGGPVDDALARLGYSRRVIATLPSFLMAPRLIRGTDLVLTVPERIAQAVAGELGLLEVPLPFEFGRFVLHQFWHERTERDAAGQWLRARVLGG